jgi:endoglycosylceramidase
VKGTSITDASGRVVLLRGVSYPGYETVGVDDYPPAHRESSYQTFAEKGFNVVRLQVSWANFEPLPGKFDWGYLSQRVNLDVTWAKEHGIYIILDMHQFDWSKRFNGNGAPDWAVQQYPPTTGGMRKAVSNFWVNQSLQNHLADVWQRIAQGYANETTIAGYDIINEPWLYAPNANSTYLDAFYDRVMQSIRKVDTNHIFFLEPSNIPDANPPFKERIVWSPHFYANAFYQKYYPQNFTMLQADIAAKYRRYVIGYGAPMWIGEFAAFMTDGSYAEWLRDATTLFNMYNVGWAWWAFYDQGAEAHSVSDSIRLISTSF